MNGIDLDGLRGWARRSPGTVDWILVGVCAVIWLVLLGFSVAAVVALVNLGRGFHESTEDPHTGLLYVVIGVSALVILAAIPVLLRARQTVVPPPRGSGTAGRRPGTAPGRTGQRAGTAGSGGRVGGGRGYAAPLIGPGGDPADRVLLRGGVELGGAVGTALTAVAAATYLMAVDKNTASWSCYLAAGVVLAAMPVIPWRYVRQLKTLGGR